jgi:hypothetical protein
LKAVFEKEGYTEFVSLISQYGVNIPDHTANPRNVIVYQVISHKPDFCHSVRNHYTQFIQEIDEIKSAGFSEDEENIFKEDMKGEILQDKLLANWRISGDLLLSEKPTAHRFIFDPNTQHIVVSGIHPSMPIPEYNSSTSDLMVTLSILLNSPFVIIQNIERLSHQDKLKRLYINYMDEGSINFYDFRANVNDDEEWDYLAPVKEI